MGAIYKGSTLVSNAIRTVNNIDDTTKGSQTTYSSCKVEDCVISLKDCIKTQNTELTSSINLKLAKTTETTNAGKAVIVDNCGNLIFGTAGIDETAVQALIDKCVNPLNTCLISVTTDITNLKTCAGLSCTGTVQTVNSIAPTDGNVNITCVNCSGCFIDSAHCWSPTELYNELRCGDCCATYVCRATVAYHADIATLSEKAAYDDCEHDIACNYCDATYADSTLTLTRSNGCCTQLTIQAGSSSVCEDYIVHGGQLGGSNCSFTNFDCVKAFLTASPGIGHCQGSINAGGAWYGFTWVPHRSGHGGDNFCYGMLKYWLLTGSDTTIYHCKYANGGWYQGISLQVV